VPLGTMTFTGGTPVPLQTTIIAGGTPVPLGTMTFTGGTPVPLRRGTALGSGNRFVEVQQDSADAGPGGQFRKLIL
jgi:hypothetical protein